MEKFTLIKNFLKTLTITAFLGWSTHSFAQEKTNAPVCDALFNPMILTTHDIPPSATAIAGFRALGKGYDGYEWDFGDGSPRDTGESVRHFFKPGKYYVTLGVDALAKDGHECCKSF